MTTLPSQTSGVRLGLDRTKFGPEVRIPSFTGGKVLRNALLFVCGAVFVLPLLWLIEASMDAGATRRLQFPDLTLDHFVTVTQPDKMMALGNSLLISLVATFVATIPSILAG